VRVDVAGLGGVRVVGLGGLCGVRVVGLGGGCVDVDVGVRGGGLGEVSLGILGLGGIVDDLAYWVVHYSIYSAASNAHYSAASNAHFFYFTS